METRIIKIFVHFTKHKHLKQADTKLKQRDKAEEELKELVNAVVLWLFKPTQANFINVMDELNDLTIVLKGFAYGEYGITEAEIRSMQEDKVNRTLTIIGKSDRNKEPYAEYDRIRKEVR